MWKEKVPLTFNARPSTILVLTYSEKLSVLPIIKIRQWVVLALIFLWILFRKVFSFAGDWINSDSFVQNSAPSMAVVLLIFALTANLDFIWNNLTMREEDSNARKPPKLILNWDKIPWDLLLQLGGAFALIHSSQTSGLSTYLQNNLSYYIKPLSGHQNIQALILILITSLVTELLPNVTAAELLFPVFSNLMGPVGPFRFMVPATIACSMSFMFATASTVNSLMVQKYWTLNRFDFILSGGVAKIICLCVLFMVIYSGIGFGII